MLPVEARELERGEVRRWVFVLAAIIIVLNLYDAMVTLAVVESGLAVEANPLMRAPLSWGAGAFMITKVGLVSAGVLLLWRLRELRFATFGLVSLAAVYVLLGVYHVKSLSVLAAYLSVG
jgi:hypothetical protein